LVFESEESSEDGLNGLISN